MSYEDDPRWQAANAEWLRPRGEDESPTEHYTRGVQAAQGQVRHRGRARGRRDPRMTAPVHPKPISAAEHAARLAAQAAPLTEAQVEAAARILASVEPEEDQDPPVA